MFFSPLQNRLLDEEEALEEMEEKDDDKDGKISWEEYVKTHYSYSMDDVKEMRKNDRSDVLEFLKVHPSLNSFPNNKFLSYFELTELASNNFI